MNDKQHENASRHLKKFKDCKIEDVKPLNAIFGQSKDKFVYGANKSSLSYYVATLLYHFQLSDIVT